jgi:hypothetical protein
MHITIMPKGQLYQAQLDGEALCVSRTPFLSAARILLERGHSSGTILTMSHAGADTVSLRSTLGTAAKLTVIENETAGPRFGRYRPPPAEMPIAGVRGRAKTAESHGPAGVAYEIAGASL